MRSIPEPHSNPGHGLFHVLCGFSRKHCNHLTVMIDHFQNQHSRLFSRWISFFLGLSALCFLAFGIIPWVTGKAASGIIHNANKRGIDTSALFYTDSEASDEAFNYLLNNRIQTENLSKYH